ncbi:MAG: hypothetical protein EXR55_01575 [Dehalococcoidia bacterium]|nr:hypothetical protein [Dehalococcoidia bacterium]
MANCSTGEPVILPDGRVRMYCKGYDPVNNRYEQGITSAISSDGGLTFRREPGRRIEPGWHGELDRDDTFGSTVVRFSDGRLRMYYTGFKRAFDYMFGRKGVALSSVSTDGLIWTPEPGVRIAPDDWIDPPRPLGGGPAPVVSLLGSDIRGIHAVSTGGRVELYFNGTGMSGGVCKSVSNNGLSFGQIEEVLVNSDTPAYGPGVPGVPGDPNLLGLPDGQLLMYFSHGPDEERAHMGAWIARWVR